MRNQQELENSLWDELHKIDLGNDLLDSDIEILINIFVDHVEASNTCIAFELEDIIKGELSNDEKITEITNVLKLSE